MFVAQICKKSKGTPEGLMLPAFLPHERWQKEKNTRKWSWCAWLGIQPCLKHERNIPKGEVFHYDILEDIIEIECFESIRFILSNVSSLDHGMKKDKFGCTLVNYKYTCMEDEPFVFANQVNQLFYIQDLVEQDQQCIVDNNFYRFL